MSQPIQIDELLTVADTARILVCSEANVYALIEAGHPRVVAVTIKDGKIPTECELDETASRTILKVDQEKFPFEKAGKK